MPGGGSQVGAGVYGGYPRGGYQSFSRPNPGVNLSVGSSMNAASGRSPFQTHSTVSTMGPGSGQAPGWGMSDVDQLRKRQGGAPGNPVYQPGASGMPKMGSGMGLSGLPSMMGTPYQGLTMDPMAQFVWGAQMPRMGMPVTHGGY